VENSSENFFLSIWPVLNELKILRVTTDIGEWKEQRSTKVY
jgi:hypothetical protein